MELAACNLEKRINDINSPIQSVQVDTRIKNLPSFIKAAAKGLQFIHNLGIIHGDIKPENILIVRKINGEEIAKLCDFGGSRKLSDVSTRLDSIVKGTSESLAPDVLKALPNNKNFDGTQEADIFSFRVTTAYTLSLGIHPFEK